MKKLIKTAVLLVAVVCILTPAFAQNTSGDKPTGSMEILRDKIKADKKLLVAENMELTESEAKGFWPVYDAYQNDLNTINKRTGAIIKSYADAWNSNSMNNEKAKKLIADSLAVQTDEIKLIKSYVPKLNKVLPATKVARYLQIENKIRAIIRFELADAIPLVPDK